MEEVVAAVGTVDAGDALSQSLQRLAESNSVDDTYLTIFAALGSLGMLITFGLTVVALRNVKEPHGELALL